MLQACQTRHTVQVSEAWTYRKGLDSEFCKEQIEKNIEIMYDPNIVQYVIKNLNEVLQNREDESNKCMDM